MSRRSLLIVSLGLNLCLLLVAAYQARRLQSSPAHNSVSPPTSPTTGWPQRSVKAPMSSGTSQGRQKPPFHWRQVESSDYKTYIANLRAIGCPEQTIRDIIVADVTKAYEARKATLWTSSSQPFKFWETTNRVRPSRTQMEEIARKEVQLDEEMHAVLKELLGEGYEDDERKFYGELDDGDHKLAFLPEAKREQLRALDKKYTGLEDQVKALADWNSTVNDPNEVKQIIERYAQKKAELAQLLTPEEYERYELSTSWTAENLRQAMVGFNPTEEEFRQIFKQWRAHDENLAVLNAGGKTDPGNDHVLAAIRESLGEDRYQEYRRSWWNRDYHELVRLAEDYNLQQDMAAQVYDLKKVAQEQKQRLLADQTLSDEQRATALQAIQAETDRTVAGVMGNDAYQDYVKGRGRWIQNLAKPK